MLVTPYNIGRMGDALDIILPLLEDRGIAYHYIELEAEGHRFPNDFDHRFQSAIQFLFEQN